MADSGTDHDALCAHVQPGEWPFQVSLTLDEQLGFTDALVTCRHCGQAYLLEMIDWRDRERVMRVSVLDPAQAAGVVRDLTRGSCDIRRAGAEVHHLRTSTTFSRWLLVVDTAGPRVSAVAAVPAPVRLPGASWRELPCDGSWVDYARSKTEMVNG